MGSRSGHRRQVAIRAIVLALIAGLTAVQLIGGAALAPIGNVTAQPLAPEGCIGDEEISFAPPEPVAGEDLLVVVRSSTRHRGVWLHASDRPELVREYPGVAGWVWNWRVTPAWSGDHHFLFFVDSTTLCAEAVLTVSPPTSSSGLARAGGPAPSPSATPTATLRPRDDTENDGDDNGNDNSGRRRTPTPTPFAEPQIASLSTSAVCAGIQLTISGSGFGSPRSVVDGEVLIAGESVSDYLLWRGDEIVVVVPDVTVSESEQSLFVVTLGGFDEVAINYTIGCGG